MIFEGLLLRTGEPIQRHPLLVLGLMWVPALASFVARLALREGIRDISFRLGGAQGRRALLLAWLYPVAVGVLAYGIAWSSGLAELSLTSPPFRPAGAPAVVRFLLKLAIQLSFGTVVAAVLAAGEEIGWRGYMLTHLIDAKIPRPVLLSALIWAAWHAPLILSGQYAAGPNRVLSMALFFVDVLAASYLVARLRLGSGSVWPAVLFHASWNAVIQGVFDAGTKGVSLWVGESGILVATVDLALVALLIRGTWTINHMPNDAAATTTRALAV